MQLIEQQVIPKWDIKRNEIITNSVDKLGDSMEHYDLNKKVLPQIE